MRKMYWILLWVVIDLSPVGTKALAFQENYLFTVFTNEMASAFDEGEFLIHTDQVNLALLLKETKVHLEVTGSVLHAEVEQVFFNHTDSVLEVIYTFPLPGNATVTSMEMVTDEQVVSSVVQEKAEARRTFEAATSSGRQAALLEKDSADVFTTTLNRLDPGKEVIVQLAYVQPLSYHDGAYHLVFPTTFGTRYFPSDWLKTQPDQDLAIQTQRRLAPIQVDQSENQFSLTANVFGLPVSEVESPTHNLYLSDGPEGELLLETDSADYRPDRDVVLELILEETSEPNGRLVQSVAASGVHGLLEIFPPDEQRHQIAPRPKEVFFIIDTSGSMTGSAMTQARSGLKACLKMLGPEDRFNIVAYDDDFTLFNHETVSASDENLKYGQIFATKLTAGGGTELQKALFAVLNQPTSATHLPMVVLLTDGDVGNEMSLLSLVNQSERQIRFFSFGLGSAPNRYLLTKLGEVGGGYATFIQPGENLAAAMGSFFESVKTPLLTDVTVEFYTSDGAEADVVMFPGTVPDLYSDRPIQISFKSEAPLGRHALVTGSLNGAEVSYQIPLLESEPVEFPGIDKVFGKAWLDELMVDYFLANDSGQRDRVRADVVRTALDYQLVSKFTSRVAVAKRVLANPGNVMASVNVPLLRPASRYPSTGTQDLFWLALGLGLMLFSFVYLICQKRADA